MSEVSMAPQSPSAPSADGGPAAPLSLERVGTRQYVARNQRGAEVLVGDGPGRFSPGDLLKIALAGCNAMTSDVRLGGALGEDFKQMIFVSGVHDPEEDRFTSFQVELVQDMSSLDEQQKADVLRRAERAVERNCTIGHTLAQPTTYTRTFTSEPVD